MSVVRLVSRLLILCLTVLMISGCARPAPGPGPDPGGGPTKLVSNPCATGSAAASTKQAPIVCVDDSQRTLSVSPDPVHVHDAKAEDRSLPVVIQWHTKSGTGDVHVKVGPGCDSVTVKGCNGNGKCEAETTPGKIKPCKYDVWITGGKHDLLDPTIVVDGCC
ncbi:MAG TPA: hypothetical protein VFV49_09635 [Thermoanaerobaculia bacterium]|nr:hypothetical protein [Thermoanaerobaculia bacterium]